MAKVNINGQSYKVDVEVVEQFSKFILRANAKDDRIEELEAEVKALRKSLSSELIHHCDELECINANKKLIEKEN